MDGMPTYTPTGVLTFLSLATYIFVKEVLPRIQVRKMNNDGGKTLTERLHKIESHMAAHDEWADTVHKETERRLAQIEQRLDRLDRRRGR